MPINHATLKTELETDPKGLGLTDAYVNGQDAVCADILNTVRQGADYQVNRGIIPSHEVVSNIIPAEWTALTADEKERISFIVGAGSVDATSANVVNAFVAAFTGTQTMDNLTAMVMMQSSRAVVLFGQSVSTEDISKTRTI